jgi:hypothetical protein
MGTRYEQAIAALQGTRFIKGTGRLDQKTLAGAVATYLVKNCQDVPTGTSNRKVILDVMGIANPDKETRSIISRMMVPMTGWVQRQLNGNGLILMAAQRVTVTKADDGTQHETRERIHFVSADPELVTKYDLEASADRSESAVARTLERHTYTIGRIPALAAASAEIRRQLGARILKRLLPPDDDQGAGVPAGR